MAENTNLLLDLPLELTESTTEHLTAKDLLVLRLVCKEVAARTEREMGPRSFEELHVLFAVPTSLDKAVSITQTPRLCQHVKKLVIYLDRPYEESEQLIHAYYYGRHGVRDRDGRTKRRNNRKMYLQLTDDEAAMIRANSDVSRLAVVLRTLQQRARQMELHIKDMSDCWAMRSAYPKDFTKLCQAFDTRVDLVSLPWKETERSLRVILRAIAKSGLMLCSLKIDSFEDLVAVSFSMFSDAKLCKQIRPCFQNLVTLYLALEPTPIGVLPTKLEQDVQSTFDVLTSTAPTLKDLGIFEADPPLDKGRKSMDLLVHRLCDRAQFPKLEIIRLNSVHVDKCKLMKFLVRHRHTLKNYSPTNSSNRTRLVGLDRLITK